MECGENNSFREQRMRGAIGNEQRPLCYVSRHLKQVNKYDVLRKSNYPRTESSANH